MKKLLNLITTILLIASICVSTLSYISYRNQLTLIADYNSGTYNLSLEKVEELIPKFPNITVTGLPFSYLKARYLNHYNKELEAIKELKRSIQDNPYIYSKESELANIYLELDSLERAYFYSQKAFQNLKGSLANQIQLTYLLAKLGKIDSLKMMPSLIKYKRKEFWESYFEYYGLTITAGDSSAVSYIDSISKIYKESVILNKLTQKLRVGDLNVRDSDQLYNEALIINAKRENDPNALEKLKKAHDLNPNNYDLNVDYGIFLFKIDSFALAREILEKAKKSIYNLEGKPDFYVGVIDLSNGDNSSACINLKKARDLKFSNKQISELINLYCR